MGLLEQLKVAQEALAAVIADVQVIADQAKADGVLEGKASRDAEVASLMAEIEALKAAVPPVSDKIFSQAELDAAVAGAVEPLKSQVVALQAEIEALKADVEAKIAQAVVDVKAALLAAYDESQVVESKIETGFADLLK